MRRLPISVFIIAKNEEDRISAPILSTRRWVDEIIVIDSGSIDRTVAVSEALGAVCLTRPWEGYGPQKVFGQEQCRNDWILNLDADEEVSPELAAEIQTRFDGQGPDHTAFTLPILPLYLFQERGHPWTAHHHPIRLYRRRCGGFKESPVHDTVVMHQGTTGRLRGMVWHRSFRSLAHHLAKVNDYSSAQAEDQWQRGRNPSALALLLVTPLAFLKSYLLRREFVNGVDGIVISALYAFQRFIRLAKTREKFQLAKPSKRITPPST